ncbi:unnamed protein product, partial [marine sediment metagenome]
MNILVTGASGFLGTALVERLLQKGHEIYAVSRHPPEPRENLVPMVGDITKWHLGITEGKLPKIDAVHHLAAIHKLGEDKDGSIWKTNVDGTRNVIDFCEEHKIPHLFFCSTSFTQGRNPYEKTKAICEEMVADSLIQKITVFKPSIIMGTKAHFYPGHFSQFVLALIKFHQKADPVRRKIQGTLRLPVFEPVHRIRGNPDGELNMVPIDRVADAMAEIEERGTFWLTNPRPPKLKQLAEWISEIALVRLLIVLDPFKPSVAEMAFHKMTEAFDP